MTLRNIKGSAAPIVRPGRLSREEEDQNYRRSFLGTMGIPVVLQRHLILILIVLSVLMYGVTRSWYFYSLKEASQGPRLALDVTTRCSDVRTELGPDGIDSGCPQSVKRVVQYCNQHIVGGNEGIYDHTQFSTQLATGDTSEESSTDGFTLSRLVLAIRHGDRSSIHTMPGAYKRQYEPPSSNVNADAPRSEGTLELNHPRSLPPALDPEQIFAVDDKELPPGQLTSRGFMQHIDLGAALAIQYKSFLKSYITNTHALKIRSTNYARTLQSVAALLMTLLPDLGSPSTPLMIEVHGDDANEVMHGIAARCTGAFVSARKQKSSYELDPRVRSRLVGLFSISEQSAELANEGDIAAAYVTDVADAALPKLCHNRALPCGTGIGSVGFHASDAQCMTEHDVGELMKQADRAFCNRYTGDNGGSKSTVLNAYPFVRELVSALLGTHDEEQPMHVYSGHDTVIAPVLAALGVYSDPKRCIWPPYASRIALELWEKKGHDRHFRLVYNGDDLTGDVPNCNTSPCPVSILQDRVNSLLEPGKTLQDACTLVETSSTRT
eukprot:GSChrysophyteH1.ASY1.ANO1.2929.1 assembled CDS